MKRDPIDKWSTREKLCLASAVLRSGDQNWMSVSRALKPFAEPNRPSDWFSQKNCAAQYGSLLKSVETPKRKKRLSGSESVMESPGESIVRRLKQERRIELQLEMEKEKRTYLKLQEEMAAIQSGAASDAEVAQMCIEIKEKEKQKEQEAIAHAQWLKAREEKILQLERVFRPSKSTLVTSQKRKASESSDTLTSTTDENTIQESPKPALSPLLTSLLKTPSHVPNVTSSILHTAITSQRGSSPTIASLLNTSASVPVSPSLQQLVSTAISQEPVSISQQSVSATPTKIVPSPIPPSDTISVQDIKQEPEETMENIKESEINMTSENSAKEIDNVKEELLTDDGEESKSGNEVNAEEESITEIKERKETEIKIEQEDDANIEETGQEQIDIYDFDNDNSKTSADEAIKEENIEIPQKTVEANNENSEQDEITAPKSNIKTEPDELDDKPKDTQPGSVEIVEVVVMEDDDSDKEMNKKVSELKRDIIRDKEKEKDSLPNVSGTVTIYSQKQTLEPKSLQKQTTTVYDEYDFDDLKKPEPKAEEKVTTEAPDMEVPEYSRKTTFTPEFTETFFDDMSIEVTKVDKSGKAKRDYSRTKKKEDKDLEILIAVEKVVSANMEEHEGIEETSSEKDSRDGDRKSDSSKNKLKDIAERSNSPWTEEEEILPKTRRRLSATPATPCDSIPNSPASGNVIYDDDRDYRTWKKSVMLVYSRLVAHKYASLFLKPITDDQAPGYHDIVRRPMDLQTVRKNVENGTLRTTTEFQRDIMLMFQNAIMYNKCNESVFNMAKQMQQEGLQQIQILLQAQAQAETPVRRETRTSESGFKRKRVQDELIKSKKRRDE